MFFLAPPLVRVLTKRGIWSCGLPSKWPVHGGSRGQATQSSSGHNLQFHSKRRRSNSTPSVSPPSNLATPFLVLIMDTEDLLYEDCCQTTPPSLRRILLSIIISTNSHQFANPSVIASLHIRPEFRRRWKVNRIHIMLDSCNFFKAQRPTYNQFEVSVDHS